VTEHYIPDDLSLTGPPRIVELAPPRPGHQPATGRLALGLPDQLNRQPAHWWWADTSGDGTHWSDFRGHEVQVDVELHTENWRNVNDWKGRDEVRPGGAWTLALNRQQCWEGHLHLDPLDALIEIRRIGQALIHHDAIDWSSATPAADQLLGRKVYYGHTPAMVSRVLLDQGCVILKPIGADEFPPAVYELDDDSGFGPEDRAEVKIDLLDRAIWWWRSKPAGDEPPRPDPGPEQGIPVPVDAAAAGCAKDCEGDCCG
jgi:hypothetical protein